MRVGHRCNAEGGGRRRRASGFTLLEVTIAVGILAFGMLGIAGMQLHAMSQGRSGKHTTEASTIANTIFESFNRLPFGNGLGPLAPTAWTPPVPLAAAVIPGSDPASLPMQGRVQINGVQNQSQVYNVSWRIADGPIPPSPPWPVGAGTPLKFIDVRVTWNETDFQGRQVIVSGVRYDDAPSDL